jgi:hypothetical protein
MRTVILLFFVAASMATFGADGRTAKQAVVETNVCDLVKRSLHFDKASVRVRAVVESDLIEHSSFLVRLFHPLRSWRFIPAHKNLDSAQIPRKGESKVQACDIAGLQPRCRVMAITASVSLAIDRKAESEFPASCRHT